MEVMTDRELVRQTVLLSTFKLFVADTEPATDEDLAKLGTAFMQKAGPTDKLMARRVFPDDVAKITSHFMQSVALVNSLEVISGVAPVRDVLRMSLHIEADEAARLIGTMVERCENPILALYMKMIVNYHYLVDVRELAAYILCMHQASGVIIDVEDGRLDDEACMYRTLAAMFGMPFMEGQAIPDELKSMFMAIAHGLHSVPADDKDELKSLPWALEEMTELAYEGDLVKAKAELTEITTDFYEKLKEIGKEVADSDKLHKLQAHAPKNQNLH